VYAVKLTTLFHLDALGTSRGNPENGDMMAILVVHRGFVRADVKQERTPNSPRPELSTTGIFAQWMSGDLAPCLLPYFVQAVVKAADLIVQGVWREQVMFDCAHTPLELVNAVQH
jgi:hypothetical protein